MCSRSISLKTILDRSNAARQQQKDAKQNKTKRKIALKYLLFFLLLSFFSFALKKCANRSKENQMTHLNEMQLSLNSKNLNMDTLIRWYLCIN